MIGMRLTPLGDAAVRIELGASIDPEIHRRVRAWDVALGKASIPGVLSWVPAYATVTVFYAPNVLSYAEILKRLEGLSAEAAPPPAPARVTLPVLYEGPDLPFLCSHAGLLPAELVALHSGPDYLVYMIGFMPGFPYLGGMSPRLAAPRLDSPRRAVPAGSVGIAGEQTGVYPLESPGGWRLIGHTPVRLYDPAGSPGTLLKAGDLLRFRPVDAEEHREIAERVRRGAYQVERS
jgi:inhibitor of KinA